MKEKCKDCYYKDVEKPKVGIVLDGGLHLSTDLRCNKYSEFSCDYIYNYKVGDLVITKSLNHSLIKVKRFDGTIVEYIKQIEIKPRKTNFNIKEDLGWGYNSVFCQILDDKKLNEFISKSGLTKDEIMNFFN